MRHTIVMVTTSYPRFPGDTVGTFMEPIVRGVAALGHAVHVVAPWHPLVKRAPIEDGVHFHFFRYAPIAALNVFGYARALRADVTLRPAALAVAPLALVAGWRAARRVARQTNATILHGHWVVPGGAMAAAAADARPVVISLHGSDVFVAERYGVARLVARSTLRKAAWVTACSHDLEQRAIAIGADPERTDVVSYGVDADRFKPDVTARAVVRERLECPMDTKIVFTAGRLVRKKGFEYLIEGVAQLRDRWQGLQLVVAGSGDLEGELRGRAAARGLSDRVRFVGAVPQDDMPTWFAAADIIVVPSVRDTAGNVDGLPNVVMEALASGTPLVTTTVGGISAVTVDRRTALVVDPGDAQALSDAIETLLQQPELSAALGRSARDNVCRSHSWIHVARRFDEIYERVTG